MKFSHTHYDPYGPPRAVAGTLLDCADTIAHDVSRSGVFADYLYAPELVRSASTGLPADAERDLLAYFAKPRPALRPQDFGITDVSGPEENDGNGRGPIAWRVEITNRTLYAAGEGPAWNRQDYGLYASGWGPVHVNPHPGYDHRPPFCENCGH